MSTGKTSYCNRIAAISLRFAAAFRELNMDFYYDTITIITTMALRNREACILQDVSMSDQSNHNMAVKLEVFSSTRRHRLYFHSRRLPVPMSQCLGMNPSHPLPLAMISDNSDCKCGVST